MTELAPEREQSAADHQISPELAADAFAEAATHRLIFRGLAAGLILVRRQYDGDLDQGAAPGFLLLHEEQENQAIRVLELFAAETEKTKQPFLLDRLRFL